ncbi:MAG TPA: pyridoxal phosphate-dependent aminotransferase [Candidatus Sulfotelmatobacter sp.]|nr:pyridoxal phosphate-dependent aminotransferase [Candidatus Sulfotelmatobacter sp.]
MFADRTNWDLQPNRLSKALAALPAGRPVFDLTASNPTAVGFHYDERAFRRAIRSSAFRRYKPEPRGLLPARRAVAAYYAARKMKVSPGDLILTTGTSEAYSFVFRTLCNPGDEILVPAPSYPLFSYLADIQDVRLARYPLVYDHGWQIDFHALEQAVTPRTRGVIVVNPNNPTGHFCKPAEIKNLNEICSARRLALIADEVFLDFALQSKNPPSLAGNSEALTFTMSGLSKISGLPQVKAAWLLISGPEQWKAPAGARVEMISDTFLSMNAIVQGALPEFLKWRRGFQRQLVARVRKNLAELDRQLSTQPSCTRLEIEGGWYAILRVPATRSDEDLAIELLARKGVYVHPGHFYDFQTDGYLVVSLIAPEHIFAKGIKLLLSAF